MAFDFTRNAKINRIQAEQTPHPTIVTQSPIQLVVPDDVCMTIGLADNFAGQFHSQLVATFDPQREFVACNLQFALPQFAVTFEREHIVNASNFLGYSFRFNENCVKRLNNREVNVRCKYWRSCEHHHR